MSLDPELLSDLVSNASGVQACREEVEHLSRLVYGRSNVFESELIAISKGLGNWERVKQQIENDPTSIAPLSGKERFFGEDQARKEAQANITRLGQAIENYADASRKARHEITQKHDAEQIRQGQSVELPNRDIQNILSVPKERQLEALANSPQLQNQINTYMQKIDNRLSSSDHRAIRQGDTSQLAKSLNVSENQARTVASTVIQIRAVQTQLSTVRAISQKQNTTAPSRSR